jgi:hypothetical protein
MLPIKGLSPEALTVLCNAADGMAITPAPVPTSTTKLGA